MLEAIHEHLVEGLDRSLGGDYRWRGRALKAVDGSSVQLADTEANQRAYPQPTAQKPGCGTPVLQICGLFNLGHGGMEQVIASDLHHHDHRLLGRLLEHVEAEDIVVGDRAFGSYEMFARMQGQGAALIARLHQRRKIDWSQGIALGENQRLVVWRRPQRSPQSELSAEEWKALPAELEMRILRVRTLDRDGKAQWIELGTTLTDAPAYPAEEIAEIYWQRWEIELRLRDLKTTMGMEHLRAQSPEMARKELARHLIAYNAVRLLMLQAAAEHGEDLWRLSFKGTLQVLHAWSGSFSSVLRNSRLRARASAALREQIARRVVPHRPGRYEPRCRKRRPKNYTFMTKPRASYHAKYHHNSNHDLAA